MRECANTLHSALVQNTELLFFVQIIMRACARLYSPVFSYRVIPTCSICVIIISGFVHSLQTSYKRARNVLHTYQRRYERPMLSYVVIIIVIIIFKSTCSFWSQRIAIVVVSFDKSRLIMR